MLLRADQVIQEAGQSARAGVYMLNTIAFANSLAILSGAFYILLYILAVVWRDAFHFFFNAQFLGADVASLLPRQLTYGGFVGTLIVLIVTSWVFAFAWAWLYNRLAALPSPKPR